VGKVEKQPKQSSNGMNSRRKFLTKAGAGLLVASVPTQSVWATGGLAGSIIASGAGSKLGDIQTIALQSPGRFKNRPEFSAERQRMFSDVFGTNAKPFKSGGFFDDKTLGQILNSPGANKLGGPNIVNFLMVGMYFNALDSAGLNEPHPFSGVYYPVVGAPPRYFPTAEAYAEHLYNIALTNPSGVGFELGNLIDDNHA
jgi:hypothetical protein